MPIHMNAELPYGHQSPVAPQRDAMTNICCGNDSFTISFALFGLVRNSSLTLHFNPQPKEATVRGVHRLGVAEYYPLATVSV